MLGPTVHHMWWSRSNCPSLGSLSWSPYRRAAFKVLETFLPQPHFSKVHNEATVNLTHSTQPQITAGESMINPAQNAHPSIHLFWELLPSNLVGLKGGNWGWILQAGHVNRPQLPGQPKVGNDHRSKFFFWHPFGFGICLFDFIHHICIDTQSHMNVTLGSV